MAQRIAKRRIPTPAVKTCTRCGQTKPAGDMKRDPKYSDGLSCFCKRCHQDYSVAWQHRNKERLKEYRRKQYATHKPRFRAQAKARYNPQTVRWYNLKRLYRITRQWYESRLAEQNECCAICGRHHTEFARPLAIDHDHSCCPTAPTCGKCNRGLLCGSCNAALHLVDRDPTWLQKALAYTEANQ